MDILSGIGYTTVGFSSVVRINWYNGLKIIRHDLGTGREFYVCMHADVTLLLTAGVTFAADVTLLLLRASVVFYATI